MLGLYASALWHHEDEKYKYFRRITPVSKTNTSPEDPSFSLSAIFYTSITRRLWRHWNLAKSCREDDWNVAFLVRGEKLRELQALLETPQAKHWMAEWDENTAELFVDYVRHCLEDPPRSKLQVAGNPPALLAHSDELLAAYLQVMRIVGK
jgi:hypothetical protein